MACNHQIEEEENFTRLILLMTKPCLKVMRAFFERRVQETTHGQTIDGFLNINRRGILHTNHGKYNKAKYFPQGGATSLEDWDVLMLYHMTTYLPPTVINPHLDVIKNIRNTMSHPGNAMVPYNQYLTYRQQIQDFIDAGLDYLNIQALRAEISEDVRQIEMPIESKIHETFKLARIMFDYIVQAIQGKDYVHILSN